MKELFLFISVVLSINITAQKGILTEVRALKQSKSNLLSDSKIINQFLVKLEIDSLSNVYYIFSIEGKQYNLFNGNHQKTTSGNNFWNSDINDSNQINCYFIEMEGRIWGDIILKNFKYELKSLIKEDYILI